MNKKEYAKKVFNLWKPIILAELDKQYEYYKSRIDTGHKSYKPIIKKCKKGNWKFMKDIACILEDGEVLALKKVIAILDKYNLDSYQQWSILRYGFDTTKKIDEEVGLISHYMKIKGETELKKILNNIKIIKEYIISI